MQLATVYVLAASNNDERLVDTRTVDFCKTKVIVSFKENREFNKRRFWATHVNRKWAFFSFNIPWRYQICIAKCLYSYRDDLPKNWFKVQKVHFRLTCVAQKRRCFNSLITNSTALGRIWQSLSLICPLRYHMTFAFIPSILKHVRVSWASKVY